MKQTSTSQSRLSKQAIAAKQSKPKHKWTNFLQLSNQEYLKRNLMLLGVSEASFLKQTKCSLESQFFPRHQANPTGTKQFFYISFVCIENLTNSDERAGVQMWYPPRTVNQQVEYKKAFFKLVQNLEILGRVPKNMVISKGTIMGDSTSQTLVEFLRFLSEIALRHQYLQKYSHQQRLVQICCNQSPSVPDNNINKFYIHPFVPSQATTNFDHQTLDLNNLHEVYQNYLKIYFKKLVKLRTKNINPVLSQMHQNLLRTYMEQKQLNDTLTEKVPKAILGENRAFDRRRIIDRNEQIWEELNKMQCKYVQMSEVPIIKVEGEVDQILQKWQPTKGMSNILQANSLLKSTAKLKKQLNDQMTKFKQLCSRIEAQIKK